jgi:hypothetical protein
MRSNRARQAGPAAGGSGTAAAPRGKPLDRTGYGQTFTDAQWATMAIIFPTGVCDYSKPEGSGRDVRPLVLSEPAPNRDEGPSAQGNSPPCCLAAS